MLESKADTLQLTPTLRGLGVSCNTRTYNNSTSPVNYRTLVPHRIEKTLLDQQVRCTCLGVIVNIVVATDPPTAFRK